MSAARVLHSPQAAAERYGYATVGSWMKAVNRRGIPKVYIGRSVKFDYAEVDRWLRARNPRAGRPMPIGARTIAAQPETPDVISHTDERREPIAFTPRKTRDGISVDAAVGVAS